MHIIEVKETGATSRLLGVLIVMSFIVSLELVLRHTVSTGSVITVSAIIGLILSMRILVELSAREIKRLRVRRRFLDPLVEGSEIRVEVVVENTGHIPILKASITDQYPEFLRLVRNSNIVEAVLLPGSRTTYTYSLRGVLGRHRFKGLEIIVSDPLKLFNYKALVRVEQGVINIKPRPVAMPRRLMTRWASRGLGQGKIRLKGIGQEFRDLREYVPGDDYRFIEWKSFARLRKLYVKEFEKEASLSIVILINATKDSIRGRLGETMLEYMARTVAGLSKTVLERGDWLSVSTAGIVRERSGYGRGRLHFYRVLKVLSSFEWVETGNMYPLDKALLEEAARLPRRGKHYFIVFTPLLTIDEAWTLAGSAGILRSRGYMVTVIQSIPELFEEELVSDRARALYVAMIYDRLVGARRVSDYLRSRGLPIYNTGPRDMLPVVMSLVERYRALTV